MRITYKDFKNLGIKSNKLKKEINIYFESYPPYKFRIYNNNIVCYFEKFLMEVDITEIIMGGIFKKEYTTLGYDDKEETKLIFIKKLLREKKLNNILNDK